MKLEKEEKEKKDDDDESFSEFSCNGCCCCCEVPPPPTAAGVAAVSPSGDVGCAVDDVNDDGEDGNEAPDWLCADGDDDGVGDDCEADTVVMIALPVPACLACSCLSVKSNCPAFCNYSGMCLVFCFLCLSVSSWTLEGTQYLYIE